ncbi:unnamed protein product [Dicrocoelium dendriticum]|nr:unnamed protein product [Dicrocoelium dendriticum]
MVSKFATASEKVFRFNKLKDNFDRVHEYLRVSLTEACNLKCSYCRPINLLSCPSSNAISTSHLLFLATYFVHRGVTKIRLTGGEPLLRRDLVDIVESLDGIRKRNRTLKTLCMTTNGVGFAKKAKVLRDCGLDSVTISLDSLKPERVQKLTGYPVFKSTIAAIHSALEQGYSPVKVNCVVMRGFNEDEICEFAKLTEHLPLEVRFIEYMPFGGNQWEWKKLVSFDEMLTAIQQTYPDTKRLLRSPSSTAKLYQINNWPGTVGFITSMTANFCAGCTRLRLTADGQLKVCLHGKEESNLVQVVKEAQVDSNIMRSFRVDGLASCTGQEQLHPLFDSLNAVVNSALAGKRKQHASE